MVVQSNQVSSPSRLFAFDLILVHCNLSSLCVSAYQQGRSSTPCKRACLSVCLSMCLSECECLSVCLLVKVASPAQQVSRSLARPGGSSQRVPDGSPPRFHPKLLVAIEIVLAGPTLVQLAATGANTSEPPHTNRPSCGLARARRHLSPWWAASRQVCLPMTNAVVIASDVSRPFPLA